MFLLWCSYQLVHKQRHTLVSLNWPDYHFWSTRAPTTPTQTKPTSSMRRMQLELPSVCHWPLVAAGWHQGGSDSWGSCRDQHCSSSTEPLLLVLALLFSDCREMEFHWLFSPCFPEYFSKENFLYVWLQGKDKHFAVSFTWQQQHSSSFLNTDLFLVSNHYLYFALHSLNEKLKLTRSKEAVVCFGTTFS